MLSSHLILCHPLLLLPSIFPSIRIFSNELVLCIRRPKYLSFSFSISPSNEYSRLISFRTDWLDLLAVQETASPRSLKKSKSQESFPTPQFKSINSLALSFLYSPILTSIHDYWKNHSFDGKLFYLSVVNLQCCVNSYCTLKWYAYILFHILFHDGLITGLCCYSFCIPLLSSPSPKFSIHPSLPTLAKAIPFSVSGSLFLFRR